MQNGGKRQGAGRRLGSKNKKTLEKAAVIEVFNQRVMLHADKLFHAQLQLAVGSMKVFRIDETKDKKGNVKREHVHVTDVHEIKQLLDEYEGGNGEVDGTYYYFTDVSPDNRAIDSMLNRTLGKPKDSVEVTGPNGGPLEFATRAILPQPESVKQLNGNNGKRKRLQPVGK